MLEHAHTDVKSTPRWVRWTLGALCLGALVPFQVVARESSVPAPAPVLAPVPPAPGAPASVTRDAVDADEEAFSYVLVHSADSTTMSGSRRDLREALALSDGGRQPLLYVRRDGKKYVIRAPEVLKAVDEATRFEADLGKAQAELGAQQAEFGVKQAEVGEKQAELGMKLGTLGRRHAELSLAVVRLEAHEGKDSPEVERQREQLERDQKEANRQQEAIEQQMEGLNDQMERYGHEMEKLSHQMEARGHEMEARGLESQKKIQSLLGEAVRKGLAEPVKEQ